MEYNIPISKGDYPLALIKGINCFLDLTDFELAIVSNMLKYDMKELTAENRKKLREVLNKGEHTTNNYIKKLKDRKVLVTNAGGRLQLGEGITAPFRDKEIVLKFKLSD